MGQFLKKIFDMGKPRTKVWFLNSVKGFTFVETVTLIAIITLIVGMSTQLLSLSMTFSDKNQRLQKDLRSILELKTQALILVGEVLPPYWEKSTEVFHEDAGASALSVFYFSGVKDNSLRFEVRDDGTIHAKTKDMDFVWGPFPKASLSFWKSGERIIGLKIQISFANDDETMLLPWGAQPL